MRLDEQLNIVLPVDRGDGSTVWVHASPISREVFQQFWLVLSKAFAGIYGEGLGVIAGPRVAALMLRRVAEDTGQWSGPAGVENGLMPEIRRLANVAVLGGNGASWQPMPLDVAIRQGVISPEDADEIEGVLVFFTLVWRLHRREERRAIADGAVRLWGASTSSQSLSEFLASLRTSTATANTGATPQAPSSPQSSIGPPVPATRPASGNGSMTSPGAARTNSASAI